MKAFLILKFFGWVIITMLILSTIIGIFFLIKEMDKDETSWFNKPLKILDELAV